MPAGATYNCIATTTLGSAQSSVTFSSITGSYTDLVLVFSNVKLSSGDSAIDIQVGNGSVDTGSNYSFTIFGARSTSATPFTNRLDNTTLMRSNWYTAITTTEAAMSQVHFMNYANTTTFKTVLANSRVQPGSANYSGVSLRDNRTDSPVTDTLLTFNGSSSGYSMRGIYSSAPTLGSFSSSGAAYISGTYENTNQSGNTTIFSNSEYYIPNYTLSNNKSVSVDGVTEKNAATDIYMSLVSGLWANSSAITSLKLMPMYSLSFAQHSTATLYGIKNTV